MIETIIAVILVMIIIGVVKLVAWIIVLPFRGIAAGFKALEKLGTEPELPKQNIEELSAIVVESPKPISLMPQSLRFVAGAKGEPVIERVMEVPMPEEVIPSKCSYCLYGMAEAEYFWVCDDCGIMMHLECYQEIGGCTTYGCKRVRDKKLEYVPAGY